MLNNSFTTTPHRCGDVAGYASTMPDLILLRHGRSEWNERNLFTGWHDVDLVAQGEAEAAEAGRLLAAEKDLDLQLLHTSRLTRAIRTANIALHHAGRSWLPVTRDWRLNERHYGDLTGKDKKETAEQFGMEQLKLWRRSYNVPPPPLPAGDPRGNEMDPRYRDLTPDQIPATECLADVVARATPYFHDVLARDLTTTARSGGAVLVVAHGNSLRALRMMLEGLSPEAVTELEIPTGIPFRYRLADDFTVRTGTYLGDPEAAAAAAAAVGKQAG